MLQAKNKRWPHLIWPTLYNSAAEKWGLPLALLNTRVNRPFFAIPRSSLYYNAISTFHSGRISCVRQQWACCRCWELWGGLQATEAGVHRGEGKWRARCCRAGLHSAVVVIQQKHGDVVQTHRDMSEVQRSGDDQYGQVPDIATCLTSLYALHQYNTQSVSLSLVELVVYTLYSETLNADVTCSDGSSI